MEEVITMWRVLPDTKKFGIDIIQTPIAWFRYKNHAKEWAEHLYGEYYILEEVEVTAEILNPKYEKSIDRGCSDISSTFSPHIHNP